MGWKGDEDGAQVDQDLHFVLEILKVIGFMP